jgi:DNA-3-methyladenine glycosylase I
MKQTVRCRWAVEHPELIDYHDNHWGVPQHDDRIIFGAYSQCVLHAGLNWTAMLKNRPVFERAFDGWDVERIASYDENDINRLMHSDGMIRNLQKINAIINNAPCFLEVQREFGSFDKYIWRFVNDEPIICDHKTNPATVPARNLAADLRKRGFKFIGEPTAVGLMQDIGMINEHDEHCFRRQID